MGNNKLSKKNRLSSKTQIKDLFDKGTYLKGYPLSLQYAITKAEEPSVQVIFIASKRKYKRAVDRNRLKRVLREVYRLSPVQKLDDCQLKLAIIYNGKLESTYTKAQKEYQRLKNKIHLENS